MNFLKRIFAIGRPTRLCFVLMTLTVCALLFDFFYQNNRLRDDGPVVVLDRPQKMLIDFGTDSLYVSLAKGDSLRILGLRRYTSQQQFLVQTAQGDRGWLQSDKLPLAEILTEGPNKGDTIRLTGEIFIGTGTYVHGYNAMLPDGTEIETKAKQFIPAFDDWQDYVLDDNLMTAIGTQSHFAFMEGMSLKKLEDKIGPAIKICHRKDGTTLAQFRAKAMGKDGKFYTPTFTIGSDGKAFEVKFDYKSDRSDWLLKLIPGSGIMLNMPFTGAMIRSSVYSWEHDPLNTKGFKLFAAYCAVVLVIILGVFWLFFTPSLLVLAMGWLLCFPRVFAALSDKALKRIMLSVSIVCTFWWSVALLGWGMFWPFLFVLFFFSRYCYRAASCLLCTSPHERCPVCHRLHTIKFDYDEFVKTEYRKGSDIREGKLLGKSSSWYQTYDLITTTWRHADGHTSTTSRKDNFKNHKRIHETYEMIEYDVTYRVDHYLDHWLCEECNHEEILDRTECTEVDRKRTGSHTSTYTYDQ